MNLRRKETGARLGTVSIHDPDGRLVTRYWLNAVSPHCEFSEGERFTVMLPIGLGGPRGMALADSTININL